MVHSHGHVTINGKELHILTDTRHSWPFMSSKGSLACHTYCDMGHLFIWLSSRTRDTHTCCRAFGSETVTTQVWCSRDLNTQPSTYEANALFSSFINTCNHLHHTLKNTTSNSKALINCTYCSGYMYFWTMSWIPRQGIVTTVETLNNLITDLCLHPRMSRRYLVEILPIWRKSLSNQSINQEWFNHIS